MPGQYSARKRADSLFRRARCGLAALAARRRNATHLDLDEMPLSLKRDLGLVDGLFRFERDPMRD